VIVSNQVTYMDNEFTQKAELRNKTETNGNIFIENKYWGNMNGTEPEK
jgi:hypothetical protein